MAFGTFEQLSEGKGKTQLICFPYLGGYSSAFADLARELGDEYEIWAGNPPGHGSSRGTLLEDIHGLTEYYMESILEFWREDCIFFGHSMGGILSYFMIQKLMENPKAGFLPKAVILSACGTPAEFAEKTYSSLPDESLISKLISYGGMPEEVLREESLLTYLLPVFRADYRVLESAAHCGYKPLKIPSYLLWGENDKAEPVEALLLWAGYFNGKVSFMKIKNGEHMFIHDQIKQVAERIREADQKTGEENGNESGTGTDPYQLGKQSA
ncbi:MAG: alpha/beta fold hydrolase [Hungatella sp.]|jgi:external thioesterase TEII|nr:alpha/beta fold hydrolase [Hungatella sp.]